MTIRRFCRLVGLDLAGAFICLVGIGFAQGAIITWGPITNISGDSDVSTNGTLVGAFNFGGPETAVNGVTFKAFVIGTPQVVSMTVDSLYTLSIVPERVEHTLRNFDTSSANTPFADLSSSYQSLLGTAAGGNFAERDTTLTMAGLTIGKSYEFQAWGNDSGSSGEYSFDIFLDSLWLEPNTARDMNDFLVEGGLGQYVIGTFVADANSQVVNFGRTEVEGGLNGFQLREVAAGQAVPEPSTLSLSLLGLALAGLAFGAKRSSQRWDIK
jgi:hypothetical protein